MYKQYTEVQVNRWLTNGWKSCGQQILSSLLRVWLHDKGTARQAGV